MAFYVPQYLDIVDESQLLSIIQEVQFHNPKLTELEKLIGKLRSKYDGLNVIKVNTDPILLQISKILEDVFGFYTVQVTVDHSFFPNAYTVSLSSKVDLWNYKKCVKRTNEGLKFTSVARLNTMVCITSGLLFDDKFTDREIVAIILHEIGHNFSDSINNTLGIFSNFKKILMMTQVFRQPHHVLNIVRLPATQFNRKMREDFPEIVDAFCCVKFCIDGYKYIRFNVNNALDLWPINGLKELLATFIVFVMKNSNITSILLNTVFKFFTKKDEYTSDSFATMYGYGVDLSSALLKMSHHQTPVEDVIKSSKVTAIYYAVVHESIKFLQTALFDVHPSTANRLLNALSTMEKELDQDYINPKFKKETKREIEELKKLINEEIKYNDLQGNYWRVLWNKHVLSNAKSNGPADDVIDEILEKIGTYEEY